MPGPPLVRHVLLSAQLGCRNLKYLHFGSAGRTVPNLPTPTPATVRPAADRWTDGENIAKRGILQKSHRLIVSRARIARSCAINERLIKSG